jgi:uncharacterized membrane protein YkvA (DUF1232 family)
MTMNGNEFSDKYDKFRKHFSESDFRSKMKKYAKRLGKEGLRHALTLYYAFQEPDVPAWAKAVIAGALGYFIFPLDAIPDFLPGVGMVDDIGVLPAAIGALELNIPENAKNRAEAKMREWFGD